MTLAGERRHKEALQKPHLNLSSFLPVATQTIFFFSLFPFFFQNPVHRLTLSSAGDTKISGFDRFCRPGLSCL